MQKWSKIFLVTLIFALGCSRSDSGYWSYNSPTTDAPAKAIDRNKKQLSDRKRQLTHSEVDKVVQYFRWDDYLYLLSYLESDSPIETVSSAAFSSAIGYREFDLKKIKNNFLFFGSLIDDKQTPLFSDQESLFLSVQEVSFGYSYDEYANRMTEVLNLLKNDHEPQIRFLFLNILGEYFNLESGALFQFMKEDLSKTISQKFAKMQLSHPVEGHLKFGAVKYPYSVTLEGQFRQLSKNQTGGTCHIYSNVSNAEAACFRKFHIKADLSDAYLFYQHIRGQLEKQSQYDLAIKPKEGNITIEDGGDVDEQQLTFERIISGNVLSEEELPFDNEFVSWFAAPINEYSKQTMPDMPMYQSIYSRFFNAAAYGLQNKIMSKKVVGVLRDNLDRKVGEKVQNISLDNNSVFAQSKDKLIQKCFGKRNYKLKKEKFSSETAVNLLAKGIPFVCSSYWKSGDDKTSAHAFNIMGYKYNEKFEDKIEYQIIDPNNGWPTWGWKIPDCFYILYLE